MIKLAFAYIGPTPIDYRHEFIVTCQGQEFGNGMVGGEREGMNEYPFTLVKLFMPTAVLRRFLPWSLRVTATLTGEDWNS